VQRILFEKMGVIYVFNPNLISNPNPRNMTWQLCLSLAYAIRQALNCITLYQNIIFLSLHPLANHSAQVTVVW